MQANPDRVPKSYGGKAVAIYNMPFIVDPGDIAGLLKDFEVIGIEAKNVYGTDALCWD